MDSTAMFRTMNITIAIATKLGTIRSSMLRKRVKMFHNGLTPLEVLAATIAAAVLWAMWVLMALTFSK
jgi:hypothetical protein